MATIATYARITLALDIIGKIQSGPHSGYHELGVVKHQVNLADTITITQSDKQTLTCTIASVPTNETNICWKAAELLKELAGITQNLSIHINKKIPVMGGMAGGSANAAGVIYLLNSMWKLGLTNLELISVARKLGMDVPFYLFGNTAYDTEATGNITPLPNSHLLNFVMVLPDFGVLTKSAYENIDYHAIGKNIHRTEILINALANGSFADIATAMHNDFEFSVFGSYPKLAAMRQTMIDTGCKSVILSGSGSTLIGLANTYEDALSICKKLPYTAQAISSRPTTNTPLMCLL